MSLPQATLPQGVFPHIKVNDPPRNPFDSLAIETVQQIAEQLDSDPSLCAFQASCRSARDAIDGDNFSLWRRRFLSHFEPTGWSQKENVKYKHTYHDRRRILKNGARFRNGRSREEKECLELVKELMLSASGADETSVSTSFDRTTHPSKNLARLINLLESTNLLRTIFKPAPASKFSRNSTPLRPEPLLHTIRVMCAPILLSLNEHLIDGHYGFPDSQQAVYSPAIEQTFFGGRCGLEINMEFVLHNINFWRYHMVRKAEQTLFTAFSELSEGERPQWWRSQLKQDGKMLGKYWKGSYAYLNHDELKDLREQNADKDDIPQIQDIFAGEDDAFAFQDMEVQVVKNGKIKWYPRFEQHLKALTPPPPSSPTGMRTRAQKRSDVGGTVEDIANFEPLSFRFNGTGSDTEDKFRADGWLNPLPPQQGIPGWQRFTMMKYYKLEEEEGGDDKSDEHGLNIDWDALWAYEGVVLPGGRIIVGRWWSVTGSGDVDHRQYSGPFVLWCVDGAEGYQVHEEEDGGEGQEE